MRHGNVIGVHMVGCFHARGFRSEVSDDLVAKKIEVYPSIRAPSFLTFEDAAVKFARGIEIVDRKGKMKKIVHTVDDCTPAVTERVTSSTARSPDSSAPCIHEGLFERCSPAKNIRPSDAASCAAAV